MTHLSRSNLELNLAAGSAHELAKLDANTLQQSQAVVVRKRGEEVLDRLAPRAGLLGQLSHHGGLVLGSQGRSLQDVVELGVLLDEGLERGEGLGGGVQGGRLGSGGILELSTNMLGQFDMDI